MQTNKEMKAKNRTKTKTIAVTAGGGVVYRQKDNRIEILLIYKSGCWDLPKGHQDDEPIENCAIREVVEETGIPSPTIESSLLKTVHTYQRQGNAYRKTTHWFKMRSTGNGKLQPQTDEGIEEAQWVPVKKAKKLVGYENLEKVIAKFLKMA